MEEAVRQQVHGTFQHAASHQPAGLHTGQMVFAGLVFWLAVLAILLSFRPWQWWNAAAGLRWRRNVKGAWAPGGTEGGWQPGWQLREVATGAAALGGLLVLLLLVSGGPGRSSPRATERLPSPSLAAGSEPLGGLADPHDVVVTVTTTMKSTHSSVTKTLFLDSIFVSLASYRDTECHKTVSDLFATAHFPERVFVGAVEQDKEQNESCLDPAYARFQPNVRFMSIPWSESKGPTFARYLASTLYNGETYYLQLDSHMKFEPAWDVKLIDMLQLCPSAKPILTTYPVDVNNLASGEHETPTLCGSVWNERGIISFRAGMMAKKSIPRPTPFIAAGYLFGRGDMLVEVPFDPDLPQLFTGEEILHAARLWTHGWDMYCPSENLVYHLYVTKEFGKTRPKFWDEVHGYFEAQLKSEAKVKYILGLGPKPEGIPVLDKYGLGKTRSIEAYWQWAGIDLNNRNETGSDAKFCNRG